MYFVFRLEKKASLCIISFYARIVTDASISAGMLGDQPDARSDGFRLTPSGYPTSIFAKVRSVTLSEESLLAPAVMRSSLFLSGNVRVSCFRSSHLVVNLIGFPFLKKWRYYLQHPNSSSDGTVHNSISVEAVVPIEITGTLFRN